MSRPQYTQHPMPHVVNGGLIDFQDNINRGVPEYAQPYMAAGMIPVPGMAAPAMLAGFHGQQPALGCVSGPPTFLQVNGVTYKPVEDAVAGTEAKASKVEAKEEPVKVMSERELERAIDERVQSRVSQFLSSQRHNGRGAREPYEQDRPRRAEDPGRDRRGEEYEPRRDRGGEMDRAVEEEVARRIQRINSGMRPPKRV